MDKKSYNKLGKDSNLRVKANFDDIWAKLDQEIFWIKILKISL